MGPLDAIKGAVVLVVGLTLGWGASSLYGSIVTLPAARDKGARTERGIWQEGERVAAAKREAARVATQADIAQIERGYLERDAVRSTRIADLEEALARKEAEDAQNPPVAGGA